jgi:hypothetical protein
MTSYETICSAIDKGDFAEFAGGERTGAQRLIAATDSMVAEGAITREQQNEMFLRFFAWQRKELEKKRRNAES